MLDLAAPVTDPGNCHRIAVAVDDLPAATRWFQDVLGATLLPVQEQAGGAVDVEADGALLTLVWLKTVPIVPLASADPAGTVGRYLARNGPSVHSLAWEIPDMWRTENLLRAAGKAVVGTDIPGRHFFVHPRGTLGMLLKYTDDELPGDPRRGSPGPAGSGLLPVAAVAWVTVVVDDLDAAVDCLRYTFSAEVLPSPPAGPGDAEDCVDVRIGDMTLRLVVPVSASSLFAGFAAPGATRYHSLALAVDDFAHLDDHLSAAGIRVLAADGATVWTDPADTLGLRLQFVDAASAAGLSGAEGRPVSDLVSYGRRLSEIAAERPDDVDLVLVDRDGRETGVSWLELESRANQIARWFERRGVGPASIVALALPTGLDHVLVTLAIWKLGATLLPLRHDLPQWEMDRLLAAAEPALVVSDAHDAPVEVVTSAGLAATRDQPTGALADAISPTLYLGASSGSTGLPKLIVAPYPGVVAVDPQAAEWATIGSVLVTSPLYHVNGFLFSAPQLLEGNRVVIMEKFEAGLAVELIERHRVSMGVMVPTMLQRIAQLPDLDPASFASIQRLVIGGAKTPEWVIDRWLELVTPGALNFLYGSTERLGSVSMSGDEWAGHRGAAGRPQDVELTIRDAGGAVLGAGEVGEVYMRPLDPGRPLFRYVGVPTPEPTGDGAWTVGDLGWLDEDGYLFIADRRADMIITGGANVFPAEVESALSEHPGVADQVVVPVPDPEWGHRVHAIVQPADPAAPPSAQELRDFCKARLAGYKAPKTFELVAAVPRTEAGKVNRVALGQRVAASVEP